jgi:uncharacterized protein YlxW (UPF0749 family)
VLGFAVTSAIKSSTTDTILGNARQADLVNVLDDLAAREARLTNELARIEQTRKTLLGGDEYEALTEAQRRADALAVLAGTAPISGPGITVAIDGVVSAGSLIDAIAELRDAGATAIAISDKSNSVRVIANTWFADSADGLLVAGLTFNTPITIDVIGDPLTLGPATSIPGGLQDSITAAGGSITVTTGQTTAISAVASLPK